jgi:hypothetical protein
VSLPSISEVGERILKEHRLLTLLSGETYRHERGQWRPVVPMLLEYWTMMADDPQASTIARRQEIIAYVKLKSLDPDPDIQHADIGELESLRHVVDPGS